MVYAGGETFWSCGYRYSSPNYMAVVSRSTDGGATWTRHTLYSGSQYGYVRAIAVDPANTDRVYAMGYLGGSSVLYSSEDNGGTWDTITPSGYQGTPYALLVDPSDPQHLVAGSSSGLFHSIDGGGSWTELGGSYATVYDLYDSSSLQGLVLSTNAGIWVWENWSGTPVYWGDDPAVSQIQCAVDTPDDILFAGTTGAAVWRSYFGVGVAEEQGAVIPANSGVSVSPNPVARGAASLWFSSASGGSCSVSIHDLAGRTVLQVYSGEMSPGAHDLMVQTGELHPGVYFAVVRTPEETLRGRFTIMR